MYNNLLQNSYFTRNVSHLSGIITLRSLKSHSVTVCISLVLNNFFEQLYLSASDRERENKKMYNKHQNTIDMQDYQAVT